MYLDAQQKIIAGLIRKPKERKDLNKPERKALENATRTDIIKCLLFDIKRNTK